MVLGMSQRQIKRAINYSRARNREGEPEKITAATPARMVCDEERCGKCRHVGVPRLAEKGPHTGAYCAKCGGWLTWIRKRRSEVAWTAPKVAEAKTYPYQTLEGRERVATLGNVFRAERLKERRSGG